MRRRLTKAALWTVALVAALVLSCYLYLRQSLPAVDGTVEVAGLTAPIDIVRDADDVPHIFAKTRNDALFGLGFTHAQDRLWQMEFQRRIGFGRLSEIFGVAAVPQDRFLRTVGFGRAARAAWDRVPADARTQVEAYVAGVNAFISSHHARTLPPEFTLLGFEPEPWTGADVLVWAKMMAWDLSENYRFELMRRDLAARVGVERMNELLPPYPPDGLNILGGGNGGLGSSAGRARLGALRPDGPLVSPPPVAAAPSWSDAFARGLGQGNAEVRNLLLGGRIEALGSNSWVVDGSLTASGKPLLANDPHLATHIPSLWYLAHLSAGDFDVAGATLPGLPAVAIGRNRFIAWGETNLGADVEDLYAERLDPGGASAMFRGAHEPLQIVSETITVKGGAAVPLKVRVTRHGPIVSDAINANNAAIAAGIRPPVLEPLALRWTALDDDDGTISAFLRLNEARNWSEFTSALKMLVAPAQNFVYADVDGHIGYYAPGRIPVRSRGDGSRPVDGSIGDSEWVGWIPFEELPHALDPPAHFIVTANNRPADSSYPYLIALEFPNPYRAERITHLLRDRSGLTADDFRAIQADTFSSHAQALLPTLLEHVRPVGAIDERAAQILREWHFDAGPDSAAAAIFEAWFLRLEPAIAGDDLGETANSAYAGRYSFVTRFLTNTLASQSTAWCDDVRTPAPETCDQTVTKAFHEGVAMLAARLGDEVEGWRWDQVHRTQFPHQGLGGVSWLRPLLSRSMPSRGDWSTINVGPVDVDHPFDQIAIPGYREIIDLSPSNDSRFIDAVGQSGHFLSSHYDDFLSDWHDVRHRTLRMDRPGIERGAVGHLTLRPRTP